MGNYVSDIFLIKDVGLIVDVKDDMVCNIYIVVNHDFDIVQDVRINVYLPISCGIRITYMAY